MSMTQAEIMPAERANYGGFVDAIGGLATIVLTIAGLAHVAPDTMLGIATIVFGAALLIQGGAMLSEYAQVIFPSSGTAVVSTDQFGGAALSAIFLVGAAGMVLGILSLVSIYPATLSPIAVIAFGTALVMSSSSVMNLQVLKAAAQRSSPQSQPSGGEILAAQMSSGSAAIQAIAGLGAIVLGILAVVGNHPTILSLVALLALGATLVLTGTAWSGLVLSFMQPMAASSRTQGT